MDIWDEKKRSQVMSKIRGKDTKPEILVRKYLFSQGFRFRKNVRTLAGTPDIVLTKYKTIIFIHGCFWHGHELHVRLPKSNVEFWTSKITKTKERDIRNIAELESEGWHVIVLWECELSTKLKQTNTLINLVAKIKSIQV